MQQILLTLVKAIGPALFDKLVSYLNGLFNTLRTKLWKKEVASAAEAVKEAGTNPELTPEQKAKEQEDAFSKLNNIVNRP